MILLRVKHFHLSSLVLLLFILVVVNCNNKTNKNIRTTVKEVEAEIKVKYHGAQVWRILIEDDDKRETLSVLQSKINGETWIDVNNTIDILINKNDLSEAETLLSVSNISHTILIEDIQEAIDQENPEFEKYDEFEYRKGHRMTWNSYHRLEDIHGYLDYLAKTYPNLCSVQNIGVTVNGNNIKLIRISEKRSNSHGIWIDGGIHAREWISPATVTYFINYLLENWEELPESYRNIDWYILPVLNPDGYEYTHNRDRLWRKNRSKIGRCYGVDLNRNFGYKWGGQGASNSPCTDTYRGRYTFSELESKAVENYINKLGGGNLFKSYLSFHSYGQFILHPWGFDSSLPEDVNDLREVAKHASNKILEKNGVSYKYGGSGALLYPAAGGSDDWAKSIGIKYSYTIELRDQGRYGFILPAIYIEETGKDALIIINEIVLAIN